MKYKIIPPQIAPLKRLSQRVQLPDLDLCDAFAAPLIYLEISSPLKEPIIIEVPYYASLSENKREIIILRNNKGEKWEDNEYHNTIETVMENLRNYFGGIIYKNTAI